MDKLSTVDKCLYSNERASNNKRVRQVTSLHFGQVMTKDEA